MEVALTLVLKCCITLFFVIDIIGALPIVMDLRKKHGHIESLKASVISLVLMILFFFMGETLLSFLGITVPAFAMAGSLIIFIISVEMILGIELFKSSPHSKATSTIVPLAFPLIAGAGTLTTILSMSTLYPAWVIMISIVANITIVYLVLKSSSWLSDKLGDSGLEVLRRIFGVLLLAIAINMFVTNFNNFTDNQSKTEYRDH